MKVLHVNLAKGFRGGERQTLLLVQSLSKRVSLQQSVLVRRGSPLVERLKGLPRVSVVEIRKPFLLATLRKFDADLVHAHEAKAVKWAYWYGKFSARPYVLTRRIVKTPRSNLLTRKAYLGASSVVALSGAIQKVMQQYGVSASIPIVPSSFASLPSDSGTLQELKARWEGKTVIGHVGALVNADKGQQYLIEAAKKLAHSRPELHFVFLGAGKDEAWLKSLAGDSPNIEFCGFHQDVGSFIEVFDYFVFPSLQEGLGSTLLDVIYAKKAIVASNVGGIPDVIKHEETGLLVPAKSATAIVEAIERLINEPEFAAALVERASQQLQRYAPERIADEYYAIYAACIKAEKDKAE